MDIIWKNVHFDHCKILRNECDVIPDIDQVHPLIRRLVRLDDLTLCLDQSDADGKIRFFQEPLLYRCQLDLRYSNYR